MVSLYRNQVTRSIKETSRVEFDGHNINNLHYADGTFLISTSHKKLQQMIDTVFVESEKLGFSLNNLKTELMWYQRKDSLLNVQIMSMYL